MGPVEPDAELDALEHAIRFYLLTVVIPLWIAAGSTDYLLHRRSHIESTSGVKESALHLSGISLAAIPVLAGLFLEVNAGVLALMTAGFVTHIGMTVWDVSYAEQYRIVTSTEQHIHGLLEIVPFSALSFMLCVHHDQALALIGQGKTKPRFRLMRKRIPLAPRSIAITISAFTLLVAIPYVEEFARCIGYARRKGSST